MGEPSLHYQTHQWPLTSAQLWMHREAEMDGQKGQYLQEVIPSVVLVYLGYSKLFMQLFTLTDKKQWTK